MVKFKKSKKGGKDTPRVAAPSGMKKFGTNATGDRDIPADENPIDTGSAAEPVRSSPRRLRSTTQIEQEQEQEQEQVKRHRQDSPLFVPDEDSDGERHNTSKTIDLGLLNEKLLALCTNDGDEGDDIPIDEQGLAGIQELQGVADYQDRAFDDSDNEPTEDGQDDTSIATSYTTGAIPQTVAVPDIPGFSNSTQAIPHPRLLGSIGDTEMALGIWAQITGISRPEYQSLMSILRAAHTDELASLPNTLDTIKKNTKRSLPLLELRMESTTLLQPDSMPTRPAGEKESGEVHVLAEKLYFFNPQTFFQAYLSTPQIRDKMYEGLGCFVDSPAELWESNMWHSSIRITSGEFAIYPMKVQQQQPPTLPLPATRAAKYAQEHTGHPGGPIFPSDFVRFECNNAGCECHTTRVYRHLGVVLGVAKDMRTDSNTGIGAVTLKIRRLATPTQIRSMWNEGDDLVDNMIPPAIDAGQEVFLLGDDSHVHYVLPAVVEPIDYELYVYYDFQGSVAPNEPELPEMPPDPYYTGVVLRRIAYTDKTGEPQVRPVWQQNPIRGELEIEHFGREALTDKFFNSSVNMKVVSVPMINFTDGFGLYRNMYRALMGFYMLNGALSIQERKRRTNVFPLTIGPHGSNLDDVIRVIGAFLVELDAGVVLEVDGQDTMVCAMTAYFMADMPQQQENSGFMSQRAEFGCRFCEHSSKDWKALDLDLVTRGRYHWEVIRLRKRLNSCPTQAEKKRFIKSVGNAKSMDISTIEPPMQRIAPALDIILTRGPEPAHSMLGGIVKMAAQLLVEAILTTPATFEFGKVMRSFVFPPDCPHLPSPTRHIGSYSLTQYGLWAFIVPPLLRCWLQSKHIRPHFLGALPTVMGRQIRTISQMLGGVSDPEVIYVHMVTLCYARIAGSTRMLLTDKLSVTQRATMIAELNLGLEMFQLLNETAAIASIANPASRMPSVAPSRAESPVPVADNARDTGRGRGRGRGRARSTRASRAASRATSRGGGGSAEPHAESDEEKVTVRSTQYRKHNQRPNLHTSTHYPTFIAEYGLGTNLNVLTGESMHRIFKEMIYKTNHRNPERDLLQRINFEMTVRFLLLGCGQMNITDSSVVEQLQRIQMNCPGLFSTLLPASERTIIQRQILGDPDEQDTPEYTAAIVEDNAHRNIKARNKLAVKWSRQNLHLPQYGREADASFYSAITAAFQQDYDKPNVTLFNNVPLQWWKTVSFDDP